MTKGLVQHWLPGNLTVMGLLLAAVCQEENQELSCLSFLLWNKQMKYDVILLEYIIEYNEGMLVPQHVELWSYLLTPASHLYAKLRCIIRLAARR